MAQGKDIFGYRRARKPRGVFSTEDSLLHFGGQEDPTGYLVQNWNVNYTQNVIEVFELGSNALYWSKGRPIGNGTISRIVGFKDAATGDGQGHFFPAEAYDICKGGALLELKARGGHCTEQVQNGVGNNAGIASRGVDLSMDGCIITTIGFSATVADTRIVENIGWRFAFFEIKSGEIGGETPGGN